MDDAQPRRLTGETDPIRIALIKAERQLRAISNGAGPGIDAIVDMAKMCRVALAQDPNDPLSQEKRLERFKTYAVPRPADEPHDRGCQVTRLGANHCCTCKSNFDRRQQEVKNAGAAGDMEYRATLGSMAARNFDIANAAEKLRKAQASPTT